MLEYPTLFHAEAAQTARDFFAASPLVDTVLLTNSCARGVAVPESDLDMQILAVPHATPREREALLLAWQAHAKTLPAVQRFLQSGPFAHIHLDIADGVFTPQVWDDGGGPDDFEIGIGNLVAYSAPLGNAGAYFRELRARWMPFYDDDLRAQRLNMVRAACAHDLDHVPFFVRRGLHFQAFDRLYRATQEFLQALFISRKTYPIAYNKWIREQLGWLNMPELYEPLARVFEVKNFAGSGLVDNAHALRGLVEGVLN